MLVDFARSIVDTARAWVDESQLVMPGYRDRIVTIFHDRGEGGLNLSMPHSVVSSLSARGDAAAAKLADRFAGPEPGRAPAAGWDNHRWIRFRTATGGLEEWLTAFRDGYRHEGGAAPSYRRLAGPEADADLPSYRLSDSRRQVVDRRTGDLLALAAEWETDPAGAFTDGAPLPRPMLRLVPYDDPTPGPPQEPPRP
jgi:hypothetical protein